MTNTAFSSLPLAPALLSNLESLGFEQMTSIQAQSLPLILEGRDIIAQAKTGSGKTAAFGLGVLQKVNPPWLAPQSLVLCPTRELADQVAQELRRLARQIPNIKILTLCGGAATRPQAESLARGAHIVVGTPGRIQDHLARGNLDLAGLNTLVLDEADRMVDMGFYDDIVAIASHCPVKRQTLLFSATYPDNIRKLAARFLRNPAEVKVEAQHDASRIEQIFYEIDDRDRLDAVARLLAHFRPASTLAFCNTKVRSHDLVERLQAEGISAQALNGDLEQRERDEILIQFANQSCAVLVATDVAARGLDIQNLGAVINVDVTKDTEVHVHRIGRSGRGEQKGLALSLCSPDEMRWANLIEQYQGAPLVWADIKSLRPKADRPLRAPMITLCIQGGKKDKLRPGDLLGALTGDGGLAFEQVGKINIGEFVCYVALDRQIAKQAFSRLSNSNIKGRRFRMRFLEEF
ncbi:ATP-dependent RNA helicase DbpA [Achromobacter denitrificans]|uniref:ATP-dependent RNA helicase DbpA n=1 Tax=Achromobacter denitrificans TaxID=32002 RepID=UPI000F5118AE|nr:ATP-dependent RNA helicase DbpA [Achromobacter denitrificans]MBV2158366.1 ATP-dependent RNA helicase DbpA [Achromobacter denitrificans]QCS66252.1 ATP-dependent RNA helicase DbpA [Achromobacter denitrificans]WFC65760.1 ATP-dependent RNA helicase DbpA [Achromobacter denitrificans]